MCEEAPGGGVIGMIGHCDKIRTELLNAQLIKLMEVDMVARVLSTDPLLDEEEKKAFNEIYLAILKVETNFEVIIRKSKEGEI